MKYLFYISIIILFLSCNKTVVVNEPADLIDKEKMATVLANLAIAEASYNFVPTNDQFKSDSITKFNVFKQSNITRQQFQSSFDYYSKFPKQMKEIYEKSMTIVSEKKMGK